MGEQQDQRSANVQRFYVPFDEWIYRNIIDLCLDFCYNYQDLNTDYHDVAVSRCENIFESLIDFAVDCDELPDDLKDPPLEEWSDMDQMPDGVVHQRRALSFVMRLMNELKRQQMKTGREPDMLVKRYGLDKNVKNEEKIVSYKSIFQNKRRN